MALLVEFNAESTAKYHAAALKYYEQSLEILKNSGPKEQERYDEELPFTFKGSLKLDEYAKIVKKNLLDIKQDNPVISQYMDMMLDPNNIKALAKNPTGFIIRNIIAGKVIPDMVQNSFKTLDESIHSLLPALLGKINTFEQSSDERLQKIFSRIIEEKSKTKFV